MARKRRLVKLRKAAVDTETTGLNVWTGCRPFMVTIAHENGDNECYEWEVNPLTRMPIIPRSEKRLLNAFFRDDTISKGFFNTLFDVLMLRSVDIEVPLSPGKVHEISFMSKCCDNLEFNARLKPLAKKYLDISDEDESALVNTVKKARRIAKKLGWNIATEMSHGDKPLHADYWLPYMLSKLEPEKAKEKEIEADLCAKYGVLDVERTLGLWLMYEEVMTEEGLWSWYKKEMELLPFVMDMQIEGVKIDMRRMRRVKKECMAKRAEMMERLEEAFGGEFNPNSAQQVQKMLFGGRPLRLMPNKRTKRGAPKTDAEELASHSDPMINVLLGYRANDKAINTFFNKYESLMTEGNVVHPRLRQNGTKTWRFTCSEPNLQQVSSPETSNSRAREHLIDIRQIFIPKKNKVWLAPDYSQIEVVVFADIYNVKTMLEAIKSGVNIHTAVTDRIWGGKTETAINAALELVRNKGEDFWGEWGSDIECAEELMEKHDWKISELEEELGFKTWRKLSKSATFTKIFGGGPNALMGWIGCTKEEAKKYLKQYDKSFPDMMERMAEVEHEGRVNGHVFTPWGQKLMVDKWYAYRIINHVVQTSAAALMKCGMLKCGKYIKQAKLEDAARMALTIHDELIFEVDEELAHEVSFINKIKELMADHEGKLSVDIKVDLDVIPRRWSEKIKEKVWLEKED